MNFALVRRSGICVTVTIVLFATKVESQPSPVAALDIGAHLVDCTSALHLGPQECGSANSGHTAKRESSGTEVAAGSPMDARIDSYLANYGKPPREAVRALLEPTDDNIRSYLQQQERTLSLAGYVASRMTALKQATGIGAEERDVESRDEQTFRQLRLSLYQRAGDSSTADAMSALAALSRSTPTLQAGVRLAGPLDFTRLQDEIGRIDPSLTVAIAPSQAVDSSRLPLLRLEDLQSGSSYDIDARNLNIQKIRAAAFAIRASRLPGGAISPPARNAGAYE